MRGMNAMYHRRFFVDIQLTTVAILAMLVAGAAIDPWLFLTIPFLALMGATSTAFDASYLIFSRQYAARLEGHINDALDRPILIAHELEDVYLFPLDQAKIVTLAFGGGFTWFGFMTLFYTVIGIAAFVVGLGLSLDVLSDSGRTEWGFAYLATLMALTATALVVGGWWFVAGAGEARLKLVLDRHFQGAQT
jgi:hypothetical protein